MGHSISIQRQLKRDLFRIAQNLVCVWGMVDNISEKDLGLYTLWLLSLTNNDKILYFWKLATVSYTVTF